MKRLSEKGFTLIEVIITIVILGLLAGISIPAISRQVKRHKLQYNQSVENELLAVAKQYVSDNPKIKSKVTENTSFQIPLSLLESNNYFNDVLKDADHGNCYKSYVLLNYKNYEKKDQLIYKVCLICDNYISKDSDCSVENNKGQENPQEPENPTMYTITFDTNGGNPILPLQYKYNETIYLPTPTKEGYTFDGWYKGETKFEKTTMPKENIILKARWIEKQNQEENPPTEEQKIIITFHSNNCGLLSEGKETLNLEETIGEKLKLPVVSLTQGGINGFFTSSTGGTQVTKDTIVTKDINDIYIQCDNSDVNKIKVKYYCSNTNILSETFKLGQENQKFTKSCSKTDYTQIGWSTTNNSVKKLDTYNTNQDGIYKVSSNVIDSWIEKVLKKENKEIILYPVFANLSTTYKIIRSNNYSDGSSFCNEDSCNIPMNISVVNYNGSLIDSTTWNIYSDDEKISTENITTISGEKSFEIKNIIRKENDYNQNFKLCLENKNDICTNEKNPMIIKTDYYVLTHRIYKGNGEYTDIVCGYQKPDQSSLIGCKFKLPSYDSYVTGETSMGGYKSYETTSTSIPPNISAVSSSDNYVYSNWYTNAKGNMQLDVNAKLHSQSSGDGGFTRIIESSGKSVASYYPCYKKTSGVYICHK